MVLKNVLKNFFGKKKENDNFLRDTYALTELLESSENFDSVVNKIDALKGISPGILDAPVSIEGMISKYYKSAGDSLDELRRRFNILKISKPKKLIEEDNEKWWNDANYLIKLATKSIVVSTFGFISVAGALAYSPLNISRPIQSVQEKIERINFKVPKQLDLGIVRLKSDLPNLASHIIDGSRKMIPSLDLRLPHVNIPSVDYSMNLPSWNFDITMPSLKVTPPNLSVSFLNLDGEIAKVIQDVKSVFQYTDTKIADPVRLISPTNYKVAHPNNPYIGTINFPKNSDGTFDVRTKIAGVGQGNYSLELGVDTNDDGYILSSDGEVFTFNPGLKYNGLHLDKRVVEKFNEDPKSYIIARDGLGNQVASARGIDSETKIHNYISPIGVANNHLVDYSIQGNLENLVLSADLKYDSREKIDKSNYGNSVRQVFDDYISSNHVDTSRIKNIENVLYGSSADIWAWTNRCEKLIPMLEDCNLEELGLIAKLVGSNKSYHANLDANKASVVKFKDKLDNLISNRKNELGYGEKIQLT